MLKTSKQLGNQAAHVQDGGLSGIFDFESLVSYNFKDLRYCHAVTVVLNTVKLMVSKQTTVVQFSLSSTRCGFTNFGIVSGKTQKDKFQLMHG